MNNDTKILCCSACGMMMKNKVGERDIRCPRCYANVCKKHHGVEYDLSLAIAALIVFFPAMTLPVLSFELGISETTGNMFSALEYFYEDGYPILSVLVFFTTIFAPFIYIVISIFMYYPLYKKRKPRLMKLYYKILFEFRHWVMLDVYIVAVLVSVIKLTGTSDVVYGSGLFMLTFLTIFSFLLTNAFSPKQVWKAYHDAY